MKILVISEFLSLSHLARPLALAEILANNQHQVILGASSRAKKFIPSKTKYSFIALQSTNPTRFLKRLKFGLPLITYSDLSRSLKEDLRILQEIRPDVVVGDFRWSLSVSSKKLGIPYFAITNAHLSPKSGLKPFLPHHVILSKFGTCFLKACFVLLRPLVFALHSFPMVLFRWVHKQKTLGWDNLSNHCQGDLTLFADCPNLFRELERRPSDRFIGPLIWEPEMTLPSWWPTINRTKKIVYVNLGSTGEVTVLKTIVEAVASLDVQVLVATAGRCEFEENYKNVFVSDYLPGSKCCELADLAITNGGSLSGYQALVHETPILGIPGHFDAGMFMQVIEKNVCGLIQLPDQVSEVSIKEKVSSLLEDKKVSTSVRKIAKQCRSISTSAEMETLLSLSKREAT